MKSGGDILRWSAAAALCLAATGNLAQQIPIPQGRATDFTSCTYYEAPNERQVKIRLSGSEASPLPGGLLKVKQLRLETFDESGKPEIIVRAPECNYAPLEAEASSPGALELETGDGKFRVTGEGFLWRQGDSLLIISNRVHTVIDLPSPPPMPK